MERKQALDFDPEVLNFFDQYVHGLIDRRGFLERVARFAVGGVTAAMLLDALNPRFAEAQQIAKDDRRLATSHVEYDSPKGTGKVRGYLALPAKRSGRLPGVLVVHENRGLNPYIEDVARRAATEGFLALAPDGLSPVGGYPGNDDDGRTLQAGLDQSKLRTDMVNSARVLKAHALSTGKLGVTGFCWGGSTTNFLAAELGADVKAAVPFYGAAAETARVPEIKAPLLIQYAESDERVNAIFRQLHYKFILRGHHGKDRALDLKCAGAEALPATDSDVSIVREGFDDFGEFLVHPVMPRSHSGNHIPRFVQHQSRAAPAVAFTTVPVSIRAWSEARSTAAFAVSWTVAGTLRKVDCEICAIAWSFVMFSWPETNSIVS